MVAFLQEYTDLNDKRLIAERFSVSLSTVKLVSYGYHNLARTNAKSIEALMKLAVENCGNTMTKAARDIKTFEKLMADEMVK